MTEVIRFTTFLLSASWPYILFVVGVMVASYALLHVLAVRLDIEL